MFGLLSVLDNVLRLAYGIRLVDAVVILFGVYVVFLLHLFLLGLIVLGFSYLVIFAAAAVRELRDRAWAWFSWLRCWCLYFFFDVPLAIVHFVLEYVLCEGGWELVWTPSELLNIRVRVTYFIRPREYWRHRPRIFWR
mmetsp:Transcript_20288/g.51252  ORF Transcript_20288/g.51252 Transcript_20288/m.51252 type:complete len:138 (-) Transcript_20288:2137-2550(-)